MKLLELLETTTRYFQKHDVESPRLTIELILCHVLRLKRLQLYLQYERLLNATELDKLRPMVKARAEGEPLQYILGTVEFAGHSFLVNSDVLIPRPETELLFETIRPLLTPAPGEYIVDVGTGSGVLAVSLARTFPEARVLGLDLSEAALTVARKNATGLTNLEFRRSDLLEVLTEPVHAIVANLPYLPTAALDTLPREVQREPRLAQDGGPDGLHLLRQLIFQSVGQTHWLALEYGDGQADELKTLFKANSYVITHCLPDLTGKERFIIGKSRG